VKKLIITLGLFLFIMNAIAQSWADSLDTFGREVFMPTEQYKWDWGQATMMNAMFYLYNTKPEPQKKIYLDYVKTAMDKTYNDASGLHPNAVASGYGIAFLAKVTGDKKYIEKACSGLIKRASRTDGKYVIPTKFCEGTCIGSRAYYFGRKTKEGVNYAIGAYIMLGLKYKKLKKKQ
jgi:rhamnogalacturonyl hydrolase YesR